MEFARIKLAGRNYKELEEICNQIKEIAKKYGVSVRGPIPLPTKKLRVFTLKTPCGDGTGHGNATWDRWEMRIHRRIIDIGSNERALRQVVRIPIPEGVKIDIELKEKYEHE
ncbi:MAG TPA: 30S ribosomal protein S10 [Candidatus Aenigmarchaeota archaeon]|nr:30S ribosomal protein S10 [Candidatus Aenigmarchaeota archaeon]